MQGDTGVALFEIVVGVFLLGLIFVPIVNMLISTNQATTIAQNRTVAYPLALGQVSTYLSVVEASSTGPSASGALTGVANVASSATTYPTGSIGGTTWPQTVSVNGRNYNVTAVGGWCVLPTGGHTWSTATSTSESVTSIQYFVAVKVSWGTASTPFVGSGIQSSPAATQKNWTVPTIANVSGGCPEGLS